MIHNTAEQFAVSTWEFNSFISTGVAHMHKLLNSVGYTFEVLRLSGKDPRNYAIRVIKAH